MTLPRDVLLFSTADWANPFWTNKQHMACELARHGFRVLYVESLGLRQPTARARDLSRMGRRLLRGLRLLRPVHENIWTFAPLLIPLHGRPLIRRLNDFLLWQALRRATAQLGFRRPLVWTYNPLVAPLAARFNPALLVYHCVDRLAAAPHMPTATIERAEAELLRAADVVFTTSPALQADCVRLRRGDTHCFPNVADFEHFAQARQPGPIPADLAAIPRPRLGFVGAVSEYKVDFELIAEVARRRPEWHWVLLGQVGEGQPHTSIGSLRLPNVHLLGPRTVAELPAYLRGFDVATVPARANSYTEAMFPLKFFEYLAAGTPVVAAHTPALQEFAAACRLVDSTDAFVRAVEQTLAGDVPDRQDCLDLARTYTWQRRTQAMLAILEERFAGQTARRDQAA